MKSINNKIESVYQDYIEGRLDGKYYTFTLSKLETEKSDLLKQMESFKVDNYVAWNRMSNRERKYFICTNVKEIVVDISLKKVLKIGYKK